MKMNIKNIILPLFIVLIVFGISMNVMAVKQKNVIVEKEDTQMALNAGCTVFKELRHINVLRCNEEVAISLNLQEDIPAYALDTGANAQIRANQVHNLGNLGNGRVIVVLDSGYNYLHPELSSSYLGGKDFVNDDSDPMDDNGHGSHVAGLITADGIVANAKGVAPDTGIVSGKVLNQDGQGSFSDIIEAIYWAVDGEDGIYGTSDDFNADAISMSIGSSAPYLYKSAYCDNVLPSLTNAINYARSKNVAVVSAAGNSGRAGISLPGCISSSITVGAVDGTDKIASFSGRGKALDVVAPGVNLYSTWTGTGYRTASGTSMATPIVSGTISLIKSENPGYSVNQIESALKSTAKDLGKRGFDTDTGYGRIDAYGACYA